MKSRLGWGSSARARPWDRADQAARPGVDRRATAAGDGDGATGRPGLPHGDGPGPGRRGQRPVDRSTGGAEHDRRQAGRSVGPVQLAGIETALASIYPRWLALAPAAVRAWLVLRDPTIDLDSSDIEVYGKTKQGVGWSYAGVRSGRVHLASWAQAELPLAAELMAGNDDVRPGAGELLTRALAVLPAQVCGRPRVRADAGYFDATLAHTAVTAGCDFAIAAKRNPAAWRALSAVPDTDWCDARGMAGGQVAACDYTPTGWPEGTYTIIRRVKIGVEQLSADPRSRRRRTVAKDQLALALGGAVDHVWAVICIVTNIPASHGDYVSLEAWFRNRTSIEERFRAAKHGGGLNHLPSADAGVHSVWMWAGLLAGALKRHAAVPDRPGPAGRHPRPDADRDPATTAPGRARPAHLARPRPDPATVRACGAPGAICNQKPGPASSSAPSTVNRSRPVRTCTIAALAAWCSVSPSPASNPKTVTSSWSSRCTTLETTAPG